MKKIALIFVFFALFSTTWACTNFIVTKGASTDGSTMITYSADSHQLFGELVYLPARDYPEGALREIYEWDTGKFLGFIKQPRHTYSVVGNMNEHQVAIGETTFGGREELFDSTAIMDYGSLIYVTLQRSKTAREAIRVIGSLVAEYGYYSSGESFSISDANECWIFEIVSKGNPYVDKTNPKKPVRKHDKGAVWVALRIPDGMISGHANHSRIDKIFLNDTMNCYYAKDVVSFAKSKGWYEGKDEDFSFCDAYAPTHDKSGKLIDYGAIRFCDARTWMGFRRVNSQMDQYLPYILEGNKAKRFPLWIKPDRKLSVQDVMQLMRDHYENSPLDMTQDVGGGPYNCPYRWRPMTWNMVEGKDTVEYFHERATSTQQTGWSFVSQSRSNLPNMIGGIFWFGMDDTYSTVYTPMYCGITNVPKSFAHGNGSMTEFSWNSAFWVFNMVANWAYSRYSEMIVDIQKVQKELEDGFVKEMPSIEKKALELYQKNPKEASEFLTEYSVQQGCKVTKRWKELFEYLMVKYMDGNVKPEKKGKFTDNASEKPQAVSPAHPRYPDSWYKVIIKETGNRYKMKK